ncbi:hypothetical protein [Albidovulum sp.]|uniref:hypothetical protein n=1 Tax=Albidovulum sp. TaxID=1872424 RepID=UPI0039B844A5
MARVTYTPLYNNLTSWPGRLFEVWSGSTFPVQTATNLTIVYPAGHPFAGFRMVCTGTGFTYSGTDVTGGTLSMVKILNGAGQTVLTIDSIPPGSLASDLAQLASSAAGWSDGQGGGTGPDGPLVWSQLLSGNDTINGTAGNDGRSLAGVNRGNDVFNMGAGDDWVAGGIGNDTINGGVGWDGLDYSNTSFNEGMTAFRGIAINMATGTVIDPWGGTDTFSSIEEVFGSRFNDSFVGSALRDRFVGLRGNDTFNGGADKDTIDYSQDRWYGGQRGIVVDLQTSVVGAAIHGTITDGFGNTDKTIDIERVIGTPFNDVFIGSTVDNVFWGGEGLDSFRGDLGADRISFSRNFTGAAQVGVNVDLRLATGQVINDGFGNTENAFFIEDVEGSDLNDRIFGNLNANSLTGRDGADTMFGGNGADHFEWWDQSHFGDGDVINDFKSASANVVHDFLSFDHLGFAGMTTTVTLVNGTAATAAVGTFIFDTATDLLYWDSDGTGAAAQVAVCKLLGVGALAAADFDIY